jgi:hypothetical protein
MENAMETAILNFAKLDCNGRRYGDFFGLCYTLLDFFGTARWDLAMLDFFGTARRDLTMLDFAILDCR